jgi:hypothetical protein
MVKIAEVGKTDLGTGIPRVHGVDGFGQFGAAGLVDATVVDPNVRQLSPDTQSTALFDFCPPLLG